MLACTFPKTDVQNNVYDDFSACGRSFGDSFFVRICIDPANHWGGGESVCCVLNLPHPLT